MNTKLVPTILTSLTLVTITAGCGSQMNHSTTANAVAHPTSKSSVGTATHKQSRVVKSVTTKSLIKKVQIRLNQLDYKVGTPDGLFGIDTLLAVQHFQAAHRLKPDGVVGSETWRALFKGIAPDASYPGHALAAPASIRDAVISSAEGQEDDDPQSRKAGIVNWLSPTGGDYPNLAHDRDIWVEVSISKQRAYIKAGKKTLYTMIVSTGINTPNDRTPVGTYHIQAQRGMWFYEPRFQEGAEYWVSFLNHGEFLFHSVPMTADKKIIVPVAQKLGHEASHGCVHLSLADAKWFYYHIPYGTKVVIQR